MTDQKELLRPTSKESLQGSLQIKDFCSQHTRLDRDLLLLFKLKTRSLLCILITVLIRIRLKFRED